MHKQKQFDYPITLTEFAIERTLQDIFKAHKNVLVFDLGSNVEVFKHFTPRTLHRATVRQVYMTE